MPHPSTEATLKKAGLKVTPTRRVLLEQFSHDCAPMNAERLAASLASKKIHLVTIYRTLNSFVEKGILRQVPLRTDSIHYERADHHHHHIICTSCGTIEDIDACSASLTKNALSTSKKFSAINDHSVEFFGICKTCPKKKSAARA